jgi:serine/threonine protein kinase
VKPKIVKNPNTEENKENDSSSLNSLDQVAEENNNTDQKSSNHSSNTKCCNTKYCAKIVRRRKAGKDLTSDIKHECSILQLAKQENSKFIIKLIQSYEQNREFQLILEYAPGEELWYHLIGQKHYSSETHPLEHYKRLTYEVALGLEWLHSHRIVDLDLKPSNIFLTSSVFVESRALIADFGLSRKLPEKAEVKKRKSLTNILTNNITLPTPKCGSLTEYKPSTNVDINEYGEVRVFAGTADFCAPEVLRYDYIDLSADMFSLGCCYYIMLTGYSAFQAEEEYTEEKMGSHKTFLNIEQMQESYDFEYFDSNPLSVNLIQSLLKKSANHRISINDVINHAYYECYKDAI